MSKQDQEKSQDIDFLYYLDFSKDYHQRLSTAKERNICKTWLNKLCSEPAYDFEARKARNLWLAHLVICIQQGSLNQFFLAPLRPGPLPEYPDPPSKTVHAPRWLDEVASGQDSHVSRDGRTYMATQKLEEGRGAFAYLAVTLNDSEPEWMPQAGRKKLENVLSHGFEYALGDLSQPDLATVLASRKNLDQRKAVLDHYNNILDNIKGQLGGYIKEGSSDTVNELIICLVNGLKRDNRFKKYIRYPKRERYFRLLENLAGKIQRRVYRIERREILLDEVELKFIDHSLLSETFHLEGRVPWTGAEWWHDVPYEVSQDRLRNVQYLYPPELVEAFRTLLEKEKRSVGNRARRRHVDFVAQLNEDLRREQRAGETVCDERRAAVSELEAALAVCDGDVRAALAPSAQNLAKDIAETEMLLEKLEEEKVALLKRASELALQSGL